MTLGETLGFAVPATVGTVVSVVEPAPWAFYAAMVGAGAVEGALLGLAQMLGFGPVRVVPRRLWVAATAVGAALAWSLGMLPSTLGGTGWDTAVGVALVVAGGLVLLASIPVLQWIVLWRAGRRAPWWVPVNMGAWAVGILWTFAPSPLVNEATAPAVLFGIFLIAGVLMAATVALLTGLVAERLARQAQAVPCGSAVEG